ncbi:MAG TPA: DUF3011 domain-containing protein, partial [Thermoanaerobaculia bacterium]|nr:DUF3011 domain-containing protein [Thermoanaerobaculia bacterium]
VALHAQTWPCESINNQYRECRIGSSGVVRMVMEMSARSCFEGATWGTREGGIVWVDRGCRAMFAIDALASGSIFCESLNGLRAVCSATTTKGVSLARQLSKDECFEGVSWGYDPDRNIIWVDHGCRGEFALARRKQSPLPVLEKSVVCESENGARKDCAADTSSGAQIVRTLSNTACRFGQEWGYDAKGIWVTKGCAAEFVVRNKPATTVRAIACESKRKDRTNCPADTRYGVAFLRSLGSNECTLGRTWGFDDHSIWVSGGCRGQFALGGYRLPAEAVPATAHKVVCESVDGKREYCGVNTARGVGLVRQISETDCVLNRSWGYAADGIWVSDGCRAEFAVAH